MPAIGVLKYDHVKLPAASRNLSGNLTDFARVDPTAPTAPDDSTAHVTYHGGLARFNSKYMSRIHTHISATDDDCLYIRQRPRKRGISPPAADC